MSKFKSLEKEGKNEFNTMPVTPSGLSFAANTTEDKRALRVVLMLSNISSSNPSRYQGQQWKLRRPTIH